MKIIKNMQEKDLDKLASLISSFAFGGFLILASGDLGAGKTRFAKGLAASLGVKEVVTSPTFNILKVYKGNKYEFYHIDAYRLEGIKQDLGLEEYIEGEGVCFIEWSEYLDYLLPFSYLKLDFSINADETRNIKITSSGSEYEKIEKEIDRLW